MRPTESPGLYDPAWKQFRAGLITILVNIEARIATGQQPPLSDYGVAWLLADEAGLVAQDDKDDAYVRYLVRHLRPTAKELFSRSMNARGQFLLFH